jgi:hypothetical protein
VSGENAAALQSILADLIGASGPEGLAKLREDLGSLPTGLSTEELSALNFGGLAEAITHLFTTATPAQLQPIVSDLLSGITLGSGTTGSLAQALGVPLETLAGALGESAGGNFSTLPVVVGEVGSTGQKLGLAHLARGLVLTLLGPEEGEEENSGGAGGEGGGGSSGSGGTGGSGGVGGSGSGSNGASGNGDSSAGGSGSGGDSVPAGGLTLTVTLPGIQGAPPSARAIARKPAGKLKLLSWSLRGRVATVVLLAPAAGVLKLSGRGVRSMSAHLRAEGRVTLTATSPRRGRPHCGVAISD